MGEGVGNGEEKVEESGKQGVEDGSIGVEEDPERVRSDGDRIRDTGGGDEGREDQGEQPGVAVFDTQEEDYQPNHKEKNGVAVEY